MIYEVVARGPGSDMSVMETRQFGGMEFEKL